MTRGSWITCKTVALNIAAALTFSGAGWGQCEEAAVLMASDGAARDFFGKSVSVSWGVAAIGAPGAADASGAAYVYRNSPSGWIEEAKLVAADGAPFDNFGTSVAITGNVAVVGAPKNNNNGFNSGSAYVYRRVGSTWFQEGRLVASDGAIDDLFGHSVSVDGDSGVLVVGAYGDDDNGERSGSAYVYRFNGSMWIEEAKLVASDGESADLFGRSVSIFDDVALVGAPGAGILDGAAYVYRFDGTTWVEEATFRGPTGDSWDRFGTSVSLIGNMAIVGAPDDDHSNGANAGSAYAFRYWGGRWRRKASLRASDGMDNDVFGVGVSIANQWVIAGALGRDGIVSDSGAAYVYSFDGTTWGGESMLMPSDGVAGGWFGRSVSVTGNTAVVGAWQDSGYEDPGMAYVFDLSTPCTSTFCPDDAGGFDKQLGGLVIGDANDLCASDDMRLVVRQWDRLSPLVPYIRLEYWGFSQITNATSVQYMIECHVSAVVVGMQNPDTLRTSIMNYGSGAFELIDQRGTASDTDELITYVQTTGAANYVDSVDGEVRVRQEVFDPGNAVSPNWALKVDTYEVVVTR